jgi:DNA primase
MIPSSTIDQIREASDLVAVIVETVDLKPSGGEFRGLCPFHEDHNPSLSINAEKQRWFCAPCSKGGDVFAFVMGRDGLGFVDAVRTLGKRIGIEAVDERRGVRTRPGVTVAEWAHAKHLDPELVRELNITDAIWKGAPAVAFPYYISAQDPEPIAIHVRRTLEKDPDVPRFEWRRGDRPLPYGLWLLSSSGAKERGLMLVEGESDFISLLQRNIAALGVPGNRWQESWSPYLNGIEKVLVVVEPDDGGQRLVESLSKSSLWVHCQLIPIGVEAKAEGAIA